MHFFKGILVFSVNIASQITSRLIRILDIILGRTYVLNHTRTAAERHRYPDLGLVVVIVLERKITFDTQFILQETSRSAHRILQDPLLGIDTILSVPEITNRISGRVRQGTIRVKHRSQNMPLIRDITPDTATFTYIQRIMISHAGILQIVLHLQPIKYLHRSFRTHIEQLIVVRIISEQSILPIITARYIETGLTATSGHGNIMIRSERRFLIQFLVPIRISIIYIIPIRTDLYLR